MPAGLAAGLRVTGLCHAYREGARERRVLDALDFEMRAGECVALLGRSGSGKSTLLNLISGIERPLAGEIAVSGRSLTALGERERTLFRRRHIGSIYQSFNLLPTLTVEENLRLPLELNGLPAAAARTLLEEVGLADRADAFPDRLSGGEQQRVAIARALVHGPSLVLADEPTGNLDAENGRAALALLDRLARRSGGMLLIATHAREVAAIADRVVMLVDGRLVESHAGAGW
jgi:putative ABC transport system ATP-binding protein